MRPDSVFFFFKRAHPPFLLNRKSSNFSTRVKTLSFHYSLEWCGVLVVSYWGGMSLVTGVGVCCQLLGGCVISHCVVSQKGCIYRQSLIIL